jgi:hypothetical protein
MKGEKTMAKCADKVIDPAPIIKALAERCLEAKGLECSILGNVIDMLRAAPAVHNAPYWATEAAYKNGYEAGKRDAVEVVRCKDCRLWIRNGGFTNGPTGHCFCHDIVTTAHDFCSYGERKDNDI